MAVVEKGQSVCTVKVVAAGKLSEAAGISRWLFEIKKENSFKLTNNDIPMGRSAPTGWRSKVNGACELS